MNELESIDGNWLLRIGENSSNSKMIEEELEDVNWSN